MDKASENSYTVQLNARDFHHFETVRDAVDFANAALITGNRVQYSVKLRFDLINQQDDTERE